MKSVSKLTEVIIEANEITNQISDNELVFVSEKYIPASVDEILENFEQPVSQIIMENPTNAS